MNNKDLKSIEFEGFVYYLLQVAMLSFGREPINLSGQPPVESIKRMIKFFRESFEERGESTEIFDSPETGTTGGNSELVKALNEKLEADPSYKLPNGF
jgi:hypothetical protein